MKDREIALENLIDAKDEYLQLILDRYSVLELFASNHHMPCPDRLVKEGERLRAKIEYFTKIAFPGEDLLTIEQP